MKKMKFYWVIPLLIMVLIGVGCSDDAKIIKIGVVGTMTGNQSDLSVSGRRGVEIAVEEINKSGGIDGRIIELVVKNDENDPLRASEIVSEFIEEGVEIVIGPYTSGMMLAAYDAVEANDILYIGPTVSADSLNAIDDHFIRFIASTMEQADILNVIANSNHHKNFVVIYDNKNIGFNEALYENFQGILGNNGGSVIGEFGFDQLNVQSLEAIQSLVESKKSDVDGLFVISNASDVAMITQTLRKDALQIEVYAPLWAHTNDLIRIGGGYVEGIYVVSGLDYTKTSLEFNKFMEEYESKFGQEGTFSSVYSYETMMALRQALESIESTNSEDVKKTLVELRLFKGLQGSYEIDAFGDTTRPYMMDIIVDNQYMRVD